jgi:hypothetical protein
MSIVFNKGHYLLTFIASIATLCLVFDSGIIDHMLTSNFGGPDRTSLTVLVFDLSSGGLAPLHSTLY